MPNSESLGSVAALLFLGTIHAASGGSIESGGLLLESRCNGCHAIGSSDTSKHPQAPPLRVVMQRYAAENLEESLAEGIVSGHPDMPVYSFSTAEIGAIVDYLNDLSARTRKR